MILVIRFDVRQIGKDGPCFLEGYAMLITIARRFIVIPFEEYILHNRIIQIVYVLGR
jgi:hypothetical protein